MALDETPTSGDAGHVGDHQNLHIAYNRAVYVESVGNSGSSKTLTANSSGSTKLVTLNANCTFTLAGATTGELCVLELVLTQDGTGSRTVTWPAAVKFPGGTDPSLSTAAGSIDRVVVSTYDGGTTWYGDLVGRAYS